MINLILISNISEVIIHFSDLFPQTPSPRNILRATLELYLDIQNWILTTGGEGGGVAVSVSFKRAYIKRDKRAVRIRIIIRINKNKSRDK